MTLSLLKHFRTEISSEEFFAEFEVFLRENYPPILLLMNINGMLVCKVERASKPNTSVPYTRTRNGEYIYLRPGHEPFLRGLLNHPRIQFGFYSALKDKNSKKIINFMYQGIIFNQDDSRVKVNLDQTFCSEAPEITGDENKRWIRDLDKVWQSDQVQKLSSNLGITFSHHNTLMLETNEIEVINCFKNSLIVD